MFDNGYEFLKTNVVLDADVLEALHRVEDLDALSEERRRVIRESKRLLATIQDESLIG